MMTDTPPLLLVFRSAPLCKTRASAGIDLLLTAASFEQPVSALFIGEGVTILLAHEASSRSVKNPSLALGALSLYGVEELLVSDSDARRFAIRESLDELPAVFLDDQSIREKLESASRVMVY